VFFAGSGMASQPLSTTATLVTDPMATAGSRFGSSLALGRFYDDTWDNGNKQVIAGSEGTFSSAGSFYVRRLNGANPLPQWVYFDEESRVSE
jgi:hypothetical protein